MEALSAAGKSFLAALKSKLNGPQLPPTSLKLVQDEMETLQPRDSQPLPKIEIKAPELKPVTLDGKTAEELDARPVTEFDDRLPGYGWKPGK